MVSLLLLFLLSGPKTRSICWTLFLFRSVSIVSLFCSVGKHFCKRLFVRSPRDVRREAPFSFQTVGFSGKSLRGGCRWGSGLCCVRVRGPIFGSRFRNQNMGREKDSPNAGLHFWTPHFRATKRHLFLTMFLSFVFVFPLLVCGASPPRLALSLRRGKNQHQTGEKMLFSAQSPFWAIPSTLLPYSVLLKFLLFSLSTEMVLFSA